MGGSYATAALNVGAAAGPAIGAAVLATGSTRTAPIWVAAAMPAGALAIALPARTAIRVEKLRLSGTARTRPHDQHEKQLP